MNVDTGNRVHAWLTDDEIDSMCVGLVQSCAKVRFLRALGLTVNAKPNGRPLVVRSHAEAVLSGCPMPEGVSSSVKAPRPNREALILSFSRPATGHHQS